MNVLLNQLYLKLNQAFGILIYGSGQYAIDIYQILKDVGLKKKIKSFVVTNKSQGEIDGIPVHSIDDIKYKIQQYTILVAVGNSVYYDEIILILKECIFHEMLLLRDYIIAEKNLETATDHQFLEEILESYVITKIDNLNQYESEYKKQKALIEQVKIKNTDLRTIVFILGNITPRHNKIIRSLIRTGYKITVLEYGDSIDYFRKELLKSDINYLKCVTIGELFFYALCYRPLVFFYEPIWGDCSWTKLMIYHKKLFGKIVLSLYDVLNDGYASITSQKLETERYCLENADGVVWRYYSKEYLEDEKGFVYQGKSIHFLDYCDDHIVDSCINEEEPLKLCMVCGSVSFLLKAFSNPNNGYMEPAKIDAIMEKIGNTDGCLFHIYVGYDNDITKKECSMLEQKYSNLKFIFNTIHSELIQRISEYDYGCFLYMDGKQIPNTITIDNCYYGSEHINSVCNRYFDYIDANLPIIGTRPLKLCDFLEEYGIVVKMNLSSLNIEYLKENRAKLKERVKKAKEALLIDNHIQRLINFFIELQDS